MKSLPEEADMKPSKSKKMSTQGGQLKPISKLTITNANRAIQKRARQRLKRNMLEQLVNEYMA